MAQQTPPSGPRPPHCVGFMIILRHHNRYDSPGRVISLSQRPLAENTQHSQQTETHAYAPAGFEPAIPASDRPQTHALDRADTRMGRIIINL